MMCYTGNFPVENFPGKFLKNEDWNGFQLHFPLTGMSVLRPQLTVVFAVPFFR